MTLPIVNVLPVPVAPRRVWNRRPAASPSVSSRIAAGWSPSGVRSVTSSNLGMRARYEPPAARAAPPSPRGSSVAPVAAILAAVPPVLVPVSAVLPPVGNVLAPIAPVLDSVPRAPVVTPVPPILSAVPPVLLPVASILEAVPQILAAVAPILHPVPAGPAIRFLSGRDRRHAGNKGSAQQRRSHAHRAISSVRVERGDVILRACTHGTAGPRESLSG